MRLGKQRAPRRPEGHSRKTQAEYLAGKPRAKRRRKNKPYGGLTVTILVVDELSPILDALSIKLDGLRT